MTVARDAILRACKLNVKLFLRAFASCEVNIAFLQSEANFYAKVSTTIL